MNWVDGEGVLNYELRMKKRGEWGGGRRTVRPDDLKVVRTNKKLLSRIPGCFWKGSE